MTVYVVFMISLTALAASFFLSLVGRSLPMSRVGAAISMFASLIGR